MVKIRLQFDEGCAFLTLAEMPRVGEGIVLPRPHPEEVYRVTDIVHYAQQDYNEQLLQRVDVRVLGTLKDGPRESYDEDRLSL